MSDHEILAAALVGFEQQLEEIDEKIAGLLRGIAGGAGSAGSPGPGGRRKLSAAARRHIAAAQKKRWAAFHKARRKSAA